jgi:hypothetical protein
VIETGFLKCFPVRPGSIASDGDQSGTAGLRVLAQLSRELIAVHAGESYVDHAGVGLLFLDNTQGLERVVRLDYLVAASS